MKKELAIILTLILHFCTYSQTQKIILEGVVLDDNSIPLEYADVSLLNNSDSTNLYYTTTDLKGKYSFKIDKGEYILECDYFGNIIYKNIKIQDNTVLKEIILSEDSNKIDMVSVNGKKSIIERKVDRLIYNVENTIATNNGTALDVIKLSPRVNTTQQGIKISGKQNVSVLINDRMVELSGEELISYLEGLNADAIKRIEVITNPPAKYSAEGNSGLLNIVLKRAKENSWNASINSSITKSAKLLGRLSSTFNYNKNKVSISSNISSGYGKRKPTDTSKTFYEEETWESYSPKIVDYKPYLFGRLGIDYHINDKLSIGGEYSGSYNDIGINQIKGGSQVFDVISENLIRIIPTESHSMEPSLSHSLNIHSIYIFDSLGKKINFDTDYFLYQKNQDGLYTSNTLFPNRNPVNDEFFSSHNLNDQRIQNYSTAVDVELPFSKFKITTGGSLSFSKTNNDFKSYTVDELGNEMLNTSLSNLFKYEENTQALYGSIEKPFGEKWETKIGIRIENTQTKGYSETIDSISKRNYTRWFPTAYIAFKPNENHQFTLNYGNRIKRPNYFFLNPFQINQSEYSIIQGNPFLQPSFTDNLEFMYSFKKLHLSFYYSDLKDGFEQVTLINDITREQTTIPLNFISTTSYGLNINYYLDFFKWWSSQYEIDTFYSDSSSSLSFTRQNLKGWGASFSTNHDFTLDLDKRLLLNINYYHEFPSVSNLSNQLSNVGVFNLSIQYLLLKNKSLELNLKGTDLFEGSRYTWEENNNNIRQEYRNYYDTRSILFGIKYKFGNSKIKKQRRKTSNESEKSRVN